MKRYRRSYQREIIAVAALLLLVLWRWLGGADERTLHETAGADSALPPGSYPIERVVDGDTLLLANGRGRVRLQGIDSPETVKPDSPVEPWGPEASDFTKRFVHEAGGRLRMEIDGEARDQHGRYLAFVWHNDRMLNEELLRAGLARATLRYDFSSTKKDRFRRAQREAQRARRGIWAGDDLPSQ